VDKREEFVFKINAFSPDTIPMARLAEYMADLAHLLGEEASVHFVRLDGGSTKLVHAIEMEAVPKVEARVLGVRDGSASVELQRISAEINRKLANDNTDGVLFDPRGAEIIQFPGKGGLKEISFGPVRQQGMIDGIVRRVGGKTNPVPVMLETNGAFETHCFASRELSKELAKHYDGAPIRCNGTGTWKRDEFGQWILERFLISNFEELDQRSLPEILTELQAVSNAAWRDSPDVWRDLNKIRDDES